MSSTDESTFQDELRQVIDRMNDTWVKGHPEQLEEFFSEDIVIVAPDFVHRAKGRDAAVASYADFCSQAMIRDLKIGEPSVDVFGNAAVATYDYEISYEMGGEQFNDTGRDLFVFIRENDKWQAAWRTMIIPKEEKVN